MRFYFWGNETFFGAYSISYNCLHEIPQNETHCECYFIAVGHFDRNQISYQNKNGNKGSMLFELS